MAAPLRGSSHGPPSCVRSASTRVFHLPNPHIALLFSISYLVEARSFGYTEGPLSFRISTTACATRIKQQSFNSILVLPSHNHSALPRQTAASLMDD